MLPGPAALAEALQLDQLLTPPPIAVLDELHKYTKWKALLKGFFDTYGDRVRLIVTGSSRIEVFRRGSDSLMGRYLLYRMHPLSVAKASERTCLRRSFNRLPKSRLPTGTRCGSMAVFRNHFFGATVASRAVGAPCGKSSCRVKTYVRSRR